jgi:hypothetical protein
MSTIVGDFFEELKQYILDPPDIVPDNYEMNLEIKIEVLRRFVTPTVVKTGNLIMLQDPVPEATDPVRARLAQIVLDRLERRIDLDTYLERMKAV